MLCSRMFPLHSLRLTLCHPVSSSALLRTAPSSSQIGANVRHRDAQRETGRKFPRISTYAHCAANSFRMSIYEITSRNPCGMSTYEKTTRGGGSRLCYPRTPQAGAWRSEDRNARAESEGRQTSAAWRALWSFPWERQSPDWRFFPGYPGQRGNRQAGPAGPTVTFSGAET